MFVAIFYFSTAQSVTQHRTLKAVTSHSLRVNKSFKYFIDSSNREFGTPVIMTEVFIEVLAEFLFNCQQNSATSLRLYP